MNSLNMNKKKKEEARASRVSGFSKTQHSLTSHDRQFRMVGSPMGLSVGGPTGSGVATAHHPELQMRPSSNEAAMLRNNMSPTSNCPPSISPT